MRETVAVMDSEQQFWKDGYGYWVGEMPKLFCGFTGFYAKISAITL